MSQEQKALRIKALEIFAGMLDNISDLKTVTRLHDSCIIIETLQGVVLKFLLVANARPDTSNAPTSIVCLDSMQLTPEGMPRRSRLDLMTEAEAAIRNASLAVENAGAHPLLTDAVVLLSEARNKVADFVELPTKPPTPANLPHNPNAVKHYG